MKNLAVVGGLLAAAMAVAAAGAGRFGVDGLLAGLAGARRAPADRR